MRPLYPGQLHAIRLNMWNVILVLDLSQAVALETITSAVATMIQRGVPIRFGIVPMFNPEVDDLGESLWEEKLKYSPQDGQDLPV
jgi:UDP-glucose:glycoprotein glucosyltransferase